MKFRIKEERIGKVVPFNTTLMSILDEFELRESFLSEKLRSIWKKIVGEIISTHSIPDRIFKNILFVFVDHSMYANELSLMRDIILEGVNKEFGFEVINDVRITTKRLNWTKKAQ